MSQWEPDIVAMVCRWCTYAGADLAGTSRMTYPATVRLLRFPCTGRMNPLFILKAFEHGADGVLVSGCHPGDCHYVQGNLFARRRFAVFRELMEFVGLDPRRLHFSWVSASEGGKWVEVVKQVSQKVREVGPTQPQREACGEVELPAPLPVPREPASAEELEALTSRVREAAAEALTRDETSIVLGYRRGTLPDQVVPGFITDGQTDELVWDPRCFHNLSVYLPRLRQGVGKVAAVVKKCDAATVVGLLQEKQQRREDMHLIGVQCRGVWENGKLADKCHTCDGEVSPLCDVAITPEGTTESTVPVEADPRDSAIAYLESLPAETRWGFWREEFERCVRCYACRAACPLCYCESCIVEKSRPQWISPGIDETGNTAWNLVRAFHLAGRCTGCDECARVCPADIRLDLINRKLAQVVQQRFGYEAGQDPAVAPPLTEFRDEDAQEFIL
jgi:coenzyme F420-reducing hydrogenase delta subunit/ferredoxin